jgi:cbb3-type cytochrome oxidase cytochrome c subunit
MNYGPMIFLAAFFALASSWCGFVLTPQVQIGRLLQTNALGSATAPYPLAPAGLARQGLEVYRANGCVYCHSQQVGQTGTALEVALLEAGTNPAAATTALLDLGTPRTGDEPAMLTPLPPLQAPAPGAGSRALLEGLPKAFLQSTSRPAANAAVKTLEANGAKAQLWIVPTGPDLARGWGRRRTVAEDYLFGSPVMPGSQRVGPDLANVGARQPDANWHLRHLYAPQLTVKGSTMPPYRFLFEKHRIKDRPSPEALALTGEMAPASGYEIVPKAEAHALVAYLMSLHSDAPLFNAPMTVLAQAMTPGSTNAPAAPTTASTNSTQPRASAP